ncbi:MAG: hypothetical protein ABJL72_05950 [Roseobacter sp.]
MTNWSEYKDGLRQCGDLTVRVSQDALDLWSASRRTTRGGQPRYFDLTIEICLTLGDGFKKTATPDPRIDALHCEVVGDCDRSAGFFYPVASGRGHEFARSEQNRPI